MTMGICPLCGSQMHLNVADSARFTRAHPELHTLGCAVLPCFRCWSELDVGTPVRIRDSAHRLAPHRGKRGVVDALATVGGLAVVRVALDGEAERVVAIRAEIEGANSDNAGDSG